MKRIHFIFSSFFLIILSIMMNSVYISATEFSFSVEPIPSSKQLDNNLSYFDLMLQPDETETLQVKLGNTTDKDVVVNISLNNAKTNGNGVVEYRENKLKNTKNLPINISDIVEFPKQVTIPAKGEKIVEFKVTMPNIPFDGLIAGGIQFREKDQEVKSKDNKDGVAINNTFSYVLAMLVRENDNEVKSDISLNKTSLVSKYGRSNVILNLQNNSSKYMNKMAIDVDVFYENNKDSLTGIKKMDMQFAPNSIMDFRIEMGSKKLQAGAYNVKGTLYGDKSSLGDYEYNGEKYKYKFDINDSFDVDSQTAKDVNDQNVTLENDDNTLWIYIIVGLFILLIISLGIIIYILKFKKNKV